MSARFGCFVTGTDTEVGKTLISAALLHALTQRGVRAVGMKPVAAGAIEIDGRLCNEDAMLLAAAGNLQRSAALTTPYLLRAAAAPHVAAQLDGVSMSLDHLVACHAELASDADAVVVEGVGGFCVPLSHSADTADLARRLDLPVVLVVGVRLGCINHALLTAEAIRARGLTLAGWVANRIDPGMAHADANIAALSQRLRAPLLGVVPRLAQPSAALAAGYLDCTVLPAWPD
ncbi:dethiobiotin synthetase [Actimicrobium sp. GrIS 1.19]|uniref:dethiobiotin synthase n=1 Tax=Actimicrobium sp. GrIS 1.19 TaxID=3071708 RepID=UPI002E071CA2|nr:dethiobiotin synthetase [Actimicrobium sp. GrIS 1.19]